MAEPHPDTYAFLSSREAISGLAEEQARTRAPPPGLEGPTKYKSRMFCIITLYGKHEGAYKIEHSYLPRWYTALQP
jgi:hypothetical protein